MGRLVSEMILPMGTLVSDHVGQPGAGGPALHPPHRGGLALHRQHEVLNREAHQTRCKLASIGCPHRRRIKTEEKAKFVPAV